MSYVSSILFENMTCSIYRSSKASLSMLLYQVGEKHLIESKEKLMLELQKIRQRVDEFNDYGELEMMQQYVRDVQAVQKRMAEVQEQIEWINKEELLYKYPVSQYPDVEEITTSVDPFMKLFQVVHKWQRAERK